MKELANRLALGYLAREVHNNAKAGNLNYALQHTNGELILTLDADQVPDRDIIKKIIGYFKYPNIGFVQTKQIFKVPEGDPFCNSDPIFYNVMQPGKDTDNAAFSCGSGAMYRRKALEDIGGYSTWNIVEDLHTSMLLHEKGWRSIYHNHPLTIGTAPADIWGVYKQRQQWAADALRIFFWDNPFKRKGLSLQQKFQYAHIGLVYLFAGFVMPLFYIIPVISLFTGKFVINTEFWRYLLYRTPSFILTMYAYKIAISPTPFYRAIHTWLGYFPCFVYGTLVALRHRKSKPVYKVNKKTWDPTKKVNQFIAVLPQCLITVLPLIAIPYGFIQRTGNLDLLIINTIWAFWIIEKLHWICIAPFTIRLNRNVFIPISKGIADAKK